jgi:hypothetical protein
MRLSFVQPRAELQPYIESFWVLESPVGMPVTSMAAPNGVPQAHYSLRELASIQSRWAHPSKSRRRLVFRWEQRHANHHPFQCTKNRLRGDRIFASWRLPFLWNSHGGNGQRPLGRGDSF